MSEQKLPYEVRAVDQPLARDNPPDIPLRLIPPGFGEFTPQNLGVGAGTQATFRHDSEALFVSVFSTAIARVQLGANVDLAGSIYIPAITAVTLPAQGYRQISVLAVGASEVCVIWHDTPVKPWG